MKRIKYLQQYDYLDKDVRKALVRSTRSLQDTDPDLKFKIKKVAEICIRAKLNAHLKKKSANATWIRKCREGQIKKFPYRISNGGTARVLSNVIYYPKHQNTTNPKILTKPYPRFIVNMPDGRSPSKYPIDSRYLTILNRLKTQSFSKTSSASSRMFKSRVAVVIATNQVKSLDPAFNRAFVRLIKKTNRFSDIACRRFGFLWRPEYRCSAICKLYTARKCFLLLKALSETQAEKVRELVELQEGKLHPNIISQIPFQEIRETILKSRFTRDFADEFQRTASDSPIYLTVMDPDFISLRANGRKGLFAKASERTSVINPLSVIGAGYSAHETELPIIRLAVRIDMAIRTSMIRIIPYSAYLPEPFLCVLIRRPNRNHYLRLFSFLGRGRNLESRRLTQNGRTRGILDDRMAFIPNGIITRSRESWKTETTQGYTNLPVKKIKQKKILKAIRGLSQSHAHPIKWADQIYSAIDFSCSRVSDSREPMMRIYKVFDPISRMFTCSGRFTSRVFDKTIHNYNDPLSDGQIDQLHTSKTKLRKLGMSEQLIDQIVLAAKVSGKAIYEELKREVEAL